MNNVGLIGSGFMGRMHANCYQVMPDARMTGVADVRPEVAKMAQEITGAKIYPSAEALLADPAITAVDICVPTFLHKKYVLLAAQAGKHVLSEKPFALTVRDADVMIAAAEKAKVTLMIAMVLHFWPEYVKFKEIVDAKRYGRLKSLTCTRVSGFPDGGWEKWFADPKRSGGAILDLHIHDTDFITHLLGKPKSVYTRGTKTKHGWDHVVTTYEYPHCAVMAEGGWDLDAAAGFRHAFRGVFEDSTTIEYNLKYQALVLYHAGKAEPIALPIEKAGSVDAGGNISELGGYYKEIRYWLDCIIHKQKPAIVTLQGARLSLDVLMREIKSAETGKKIKI